MGYTSVYETARGRRKHFNNRDGRLGNTPDQPEREFRMERRGRRRRGRGEFVKSVESVQQFRGWRVERRWDLRPGGQLGWGTMAEQQLCQ
jgi:hypothetical protein